MEKLKPATGAAETVPSPESPDYLGERMRGLAESYAKMAIPLGEREDFLGHAENVRSMVEAFAGNKLPPVALEGVLLHDVVDRFSNVKGPKYHPVRADVAGESLIGLFSDPTIGNDAQNYLAHILPDMVSTEIASIKHRKDMATEARKNGTQDGRLSEVSQDTVNMISNRYQGDVPPDVWRAITPLLDFKHMKEFTEKTNVEAIIIKAVELLVNIQHPSSERPSALLQDVLEAESFYAPIVEAMGLEGLSMALRSEAHCVRLTQQGKEASVREAEAKSSEIANTGPDKLISQALGLSFDDCAVSRAVGGVVEPGKENSEYPVHIGEFAFEGQDGRAVVGNWRIKSTGSLAVKCEHQKNCMPMDMLGMMVISENEELLVEDFAEYISSHVMPSAESGATELKPAPSKNCPIYIQGSPAYKEAIMNEMRKRKVDESLIQFDSEDKKTDEDRHGEYRKYEVAKVTFMMNVYDDNGEVVEVPTEVQFLTKDERRRSRLGSIAHIIYKYITQQKAIKGRDLTPEEKREIIDSASSVLGALYDRAQKMNKDSLEANPYSDENANQLMEALHRFMNKSMDEPQNSSDSISATIES